MQFAPRSGLVVAAAAIALNAGLVDCASSAPAANSASGAPAAGSASASSSGQSIGRSRAVYQIAGLPCGTLQGDAATVALHEKECEAGKGSECYAATAHYTCGVGVATDFVKAEAFAERGCDAGYLRSCTNVGSLSIGFIEGAPKDVAKGVKYLERGCAAKSEDCCNNLAILYWRGFGVAANPERAAAILEDACAHGAMSACANLGGFYLQGNGDFARNDAKARTYATMACDHDESAGCDGLTILETDPVKAFAYAKRSCDLGGIAGCGNMALFYRNGRGVAKDAAKAQKLFERACEMGDPVSCKEAGRL